ncbi:MAG TPA: SpoIIE family protein phosphatase [Bellilinea sp.]|nr:SpoIIE family protein phosphatase [Bellilinea sp.]
MITAQESELRQVPLFEVLTNAELAEVSTRFSALTLSAGEILFRENEAGDTLYIVAQGQVEIIKSLGAAGERRLAVRGEAEFFGEMSLISLEHVRTATARALTEVRLLCLTKADFDNLLLNHPQLAYEMVRVLSNRLNESHNRSIRDLMKINQDLVQANADLVAAQAQLIEKEKLERELQVGQEIQRSILPQSLPLLPGVELGAIMEPARMVGGDFYDVIPLKGDKAALIIGDVTDKGIPAAIFMAQTFALIHSAVSPNVSPKTTLLKVNKSLLEMNAGGLFVTALYGILDLKTHEFHYARAGHETPVIALPGKAAAECRAQLGQPLGILDKPVIDEQRVVLPPGSVMLLYTDGLTDNLAKHTGSMDGNSSTAGSISHPTPKSQWMELFGALRNAPAQAICTSIYRAVTRPPQFDDVTLLVLKVA